MKRIIISVIVGIAIGAIGTAWTLNQVIEDLTASSTYYKNENARYTNTVDGMVNLGWSEERIQSYIDRGCVPYLEYVKER